MRKTYQNKKGLSTIISTILMIIVVMVGMTILFAYVTVYANNYQTGTGGSILESSTIEDAWITSPHTVQLTVYNTGTATNLGTNVDLTVAAVYVNGTALTTISSTGVSTNNINFDWSIPAGYHISVNGYYSTGFQSGQTYEFKIVTERGSNFEVQYTDP
jgi:heme/copper-type cytochrome/quinol oxidase subunit 2